MDTLRDNAGPEEKRTIYLQATKAILKYNVQEQVQGVSSVRPNVFSPLYATYKNPSSSRSFSYNCPMVKLDCGTVLSTKRKIAFSEGSWIRFLIIHINCATVMSEGTRYFRLSMSTICEPETFSTITGTRSGYFALIFADSTHLCSREWSSLNIHFMVRVGWGRDRSCSGSDSDNNNTTDGPASSDVT